jgi:endonuclease/exonuclease/phosphatase family metal-dependent hydrolase
MKRAVVAAISLAALVSCTSSSSSSTAAAPTTVRVGQLNIEYGGEVIDFDKTIEAAAALDADVIGIEEAWGNIPDLAKGLGWPYYDASRQIVSRLPLLQAPGNPVEYTFVEVSPGQVVAIGNVHLPSVHYGPNLTRRGEAAADILAKETKVRLPAIEPYATALAGVAANGTPSFLVGDFNSPSHLDWTEAAVGSRSHVTYPLAWPVTEELAQMGFQDSYRTVHPDPVADPGLTWPAARPKSKKSWNPPPTAPADRIDYVMAIGSATPTDSRIVGEDDVEPWPSDHRGMVSTFTITPATTPVLVAPDQRLWTVGDDVAIHVHSDAASGQLTVTPEGASEPVATSSTADASSDQLVTLDSTAWPTGRYDVTLTDDAGATIANAPIWLQEPGDGPTLTVEPVIASGEPIDVGWTNAPGNRWDWIGIYKRGADPNVAYYLVWAYTDATIEGSVSLDESAEGKFPLPPGKYTAMLLVDDAYEAVATAAFTIS